MKSTYTFRGPAHRVQLVIYDFTTDDTPPAVKEDRPKFCVKVLPAAANPYHAFSRGDQVYYGDDPDAAWDSAKRWVPDLFRQAPKTLRDYLVRWGKERS